MGGLRKGGLLIAKVHQVAGRIFAKKLKQHGICNINPAQGRILFVLWENDGISISQLADKTLLEHSTLTSMLDRLEDAGYVIRTASPEDRRKTIIMRTEKDKQLQELYQKVSAEMIELFYKRFSDNEIDEFEKALDRIINNLTAWEKG